MLKIAFIISGLGTGGAEKSLVEFLERIDRSKFDPVVFSMRGAGAYGDYIKELGVPLYPFDLRTRGKIKILLKMARALRREKPNLVHCWMYHANVIGGLVAYFTQKAPIIWSVRAGAYEVLAKHRNKTWLVLKASILLSRFLPSSIVYNSLFSKTVHEGLGFPKHKSLVVENGFDPKVFVPSRALRKQFRAELDIPDADFVFGIVARFDPVKGHSMFARVAIEVAAQHSTVHFVFVGRDVTAENIGISQELEFAGSKQFHFLGRRADLPRIFPGFDGVILPSLSESFPRVLGEAMLCGVPCIATEVGDCARIIGETGMICAPGSADELRSCISRLLNYSAATREALGASARQRIISFFPATKCLDLHLKLYASLSSN